MRKEPEAVLPDAVEACRARLAGDLMDPEAAAGLRASLAAMNPRFRPAGVLGEVCDVLDGAASVAGSDEGAGIPPLITAHLHESLIVHPREKAERQHRLASLLGRLVHMLAGDDSVRGIARVTERATPERYPRLVQLVTACSAALELQDPTIHLARGDEAIFAPFVDRSPFLCIHHDYIAGDGDGSRRAPILSPLELRFGIGHQLEHIRGGHAPWLQLSPERLEGLILDEVPFLVRTPLKFATRAVGWTRANVAVKKVGGLLPRKSRVRRVVHTIGDLLPAHDQETVLPDVIHDQLRAWIQGVEYSADRAGLVLSGSVTAACSGVLQMSPGGRGLLPGITQQGMRQAMAAETEEGSRELAALWDRVAEILRFALSTEFLAFSATGSPATEEGPL